MNKGPVNDGGRELQEEGGRGKNKPWGPRLGGHRYQRALLLLPLNLTEMKNGDTGKIASPRSTHLPKSRGTDEGYLKREAGMKRRVSTHIAKDSDAFEKKEAEIILLGAGRKKAKQGAVSGR